jgi:hypothetical protein
MITVFPSFLTMTTSDLFAYQLVVCALLFGKHCSKTCHKFMTRFLFSFEYFKRWYTVWIINVKNIELYKNDIKIQTKTSVLSKFNQYIYSKSKKKYRIFRLFFKVVDCDLVHRILFYEHLVLVT